MKKLILLVCISSIFSLSCLAQKIEKTAANNKTVEFHKLYLHTDREFFFEGDTLWFAAYLLNGQTHLPVEEKCNLSVDIINEDGEVVQNNLYLVFNGSCSGNLSLDIQNIPEGKYLLRAYTDYLKNFGTDAFFTKNIRVSSVKNSFEPEVDKSKDGTREGQKLDVQFLPEGGFLLSGKSNCVAFKVLNEKGKGVEISGKLFDSQNNEVLKFQSIYKGAGKFYFIPKAGEKYSVKIDGRDKSTIKLPEARNTGALIKLIAQSERAVSFMIQKQGMSSKLPLKMACISRGESLFIIDVDTEKINAVLSIGAEKLRNGINRFVLYDNQMNPLSERLIFQNKVEINKLKVRIGDDSYGKREEVQLNISPSALNRNETALVSVAVVDENYVNASGISENIASYLLLNSELKGNVESPANYFIEDKNLNSQTKLDLLMCTNGWSNYQWNYLFPTDVNFDYKPMFGFDFSGKVKKAIGKKGVDDGNVFFMVKSKERTQFLDLPLNIDGSFAFEEIVFFDSASVFAQGRNKRDKNTIKFDMTFPDIAPFEVDKNSLQLFQNDVKIPVSVYRQHYINELRRKEFFPDKENILLDEIEVKRKSYIEKWKTGKEKKGDGPYLLTTIKTAGNTNIIEYLQTKVPGVWPTRGRQSITFSPGAAANLESMDPEPLFWIDYHLKLTVDEIRNYSIDIFETIELISPPASYFYRAPNGAVLLTTKTGKLHDKRNAVLLGGAVKVMNGFTKVREFYSPKYSAENLDSEIPDYRNTLYWNPALILSGEQNVFFHACDNVSHYRVFVEGITETGKICIGEAEFVVE